MIRFVVGASLIFLFAVASGFALHAGLLRARFSGAGDVARSFTLDLHEGHYEEARRRMSAEYAAELGAADLEASARAIDALVRTDRVAIASLEHQDDGARAVVGLTLFVERERVPARIELVDRNGAWFVDHAVIRGTALHE